VWCSALQCDAVRCSVMQCVAVWCSALQCDAVRFSVMQCVAVWCSALQCDAVCCSVMQCVAVWCSVLQYLQGQPKETDASEEAVHIPSVWYSVLHCVEWSVLEIVGVWCSVLECFGVCCSVLSYLQGRPKETDGSEEAVHNPFDSSKMQPDPSLITIKLNPTHQKVKHKLNPEN